MPRHDPPINNSRLEAAELVCLLYGWTSGGEDTDRGKATLQAWMQWSNLVGDEFIDQQRSVITDEVIERLARIRDEIHDRTMARIDSWLGAEVVARLNKAKAEI